jgi:hypothetical protein
VGTGGAGGAATPGLYAVPKPKEEKENPLSALAEGVAGLGGKGGGGFDYNVTPQPAAARTSTQAAPMINPEQADQQRQMLAMALARLNQGTLF